jgi:hypothetical protein
MAKNNTGEDIKGTTNYLGPYESWMFGPGKDYDLPALGLDDLHALSCIASFPDLSFVRTGFDVQSLRNRQIFLPELWNENKISHVPFVSFRKELSIINISPDIISDLIDIVASIFEKASVGRPGHFRLNLPLAPNSFNPNALPKTKANLPGNKNPKPLVVLGIIDDGIPFAHTAFRKLKQPDETRINAYWHQSAEAVKGGTDVFGRSFTGADINRLIKAHDGDEDAIYRAAGVVSEPGKMPMPLDGAYSHGAHTLGIMAANWPKDTEDNSPIVAVDLPSTSSWDTSGFGKDMYILSALHYIFARADEIAQANGLKHVPLVINLSYGHTGGGHDGSNVLEAAIDELVDLRRKTGSPTIIVMPTGNAFDALLHAEITDQHFAAADGAVTLDWVVQPNDHTSSYLEIWYPQGETPDDYQLTITAPDGEVFHPVNAGSQNTRPGNGGTGTTDPRPKTMQPYCAISTEKYRNMRWRVVLAIAPTEPRNLKKPAAPAGYWQIEMARNASNAKGVSAVQLWIQRDENFGQSATGAKQSVFAARAEDDLYAGEMPVPLIRRFGSMNGMATGRTTLTAAGLTASSLQAAKYGGSGTLRPDFKTVSGAKWHISGKQVDVSSVTERSDFLPGIIGIGTRSGSRAAFSGTSAASPNIARAFALAFLAGLEPQDLTKTQDYAKMLIGRPGFQKLATKNGPTKSEIPRLGGNSSTQLFPAA